MHGIRVQCECLIEESRYQECIQVQILATQEEDVQPYEQEEEQEDLEESSAGTQMEKEWRQSRGAELVEIRGS